MAEAVVEEMQSAVASAVTEGETEGLRWNDLRQAISDVLLSSRAFVKLCRGCSAGFYLELASSTCQQCPGQLSSDHGSRGRGSCHWVALPDASAVPPSQPSFSGCMGAEHVGAGEGPSGGARSAALGEGVPAWRPRSARVLLLQPAEMARVLRNVSSALQEMRAQGWLVLDMNDESLTLGTLQLAGGTAAQHQGLVIRNGQLVLDQLSIAAPRTGADALPGLDVILDDVRIAETALGGLPVRQAEVAEPPQARTACNDTLNAHGLLQVSGDGARVWLNNVRVSSTRSAALAALGGAEAGASCSAFEAAAAPAVVYAAGRGTRVELARSVVGPGTSGSVVLERGAVVQLNGGTKVEGMAGGDAVSVRHADTMLAASRANVSAPCGRAVSLCGRALASLLDSSVSAGGAEQGCDPGQGVGVRAASGSTAQLEAVQVLGAGHAGVQIVGGGRVQADECAVSGSAALGVQALGRGSSFHALRSTLQGSLSSNLVLSDGAAAELRHCQIASSHLAAGVEVHGNGTYLQAWNCSVVDNAGSNVHVSAGGRAVFRGGIVAGSAMKHGAEVQGRGSQLHMWRTAVFSNAATNLLASDRAELELRYATVSGRSQGRRARALLGVHATSGAAVRAWYTNISSVVQSSITVDGAAQLQISFSQLSNTLSNDFPLLLVSGEGSLAEAVHCGLDSGSLAMNVTDRASLRLHASVVRSKRSGAVAASGKASLSAWACRFAWNAQPAAVQVYSGAQAELWNCNVHGTAEGAGLMVAGRGSSALCSKTTFLDNAGTAVNVSKHGSATLTDCLLQKARIGLLVLDSGAASCSNCTVLDMLDRGMFVSEQGSLLLQDSLVDGTASGHGVEVSGNGSTLMARGCVFRSSASAGVNANGLGALCQLQECEIANNTIGRRGGLEVEEGARLEARRLHVNLNYDGIIIRSQSTAHLQDCRVINSERNGLRARSAETKICVRGGSFSNSGQSNIVVDGASGVLQGFEARNAGRSGVLIYNPDPAHRFRIQNALIDGNYESGVRVEGSGMILVELSAVELANNGVLGLDVMPVGDPGVEVTIRDSKIHDNFNANLEVRRGALLMAFDCEVYAGGNGIVARDVNTSLVVGNCSILGNSLSGIVVTDFARAQVSSSQVVNNTEDGVDADRFANLLLSKTLATGNGFDGQGYGVLVEEGSTMNMESCDVTDNGAGSVRVGLNSSISVETSRLSPAPAQLERQGDGAICWPPALVQDCDRVRDAQLVSPSSDATLTADAGAASKHEAC